MYKFSSVCIQLITRMAVKNFVYIYFFLSTFVYSIYKVQSILPPSYKTDSTHAPFTVYIRNRHHYCGGVILSEHIVLTASHCIDEHYNMFVTAGRSTKYDNENVQIVGVEKTLPHENYLLDPNGIQAYYDIGLLRLQTPLTFNEYVKPIEWTTIDIGNPQVTIYGWGSTDAFQNRPSYYLRAKNITLISDSLCIDMLNKAITKCNKQVYELCAEKSACHGDSGSPIVQKVDNVTKLIGVTSWLADDNIDCNTGPAVFENVGYFSKWIKEGIRALMKGNVTENLDDSENVVQTHH